MSTLFVVEEKVQDGLCHTNRFAFCLAKGGGMFGATLLTVPPHPARRCALDPPTLTDAWDVMSKIEKETMDGRLNLRCPKDEENRIREDAELAGVSISEMVRRRYFGRRVIADVDRVMIRELRRLGGLLKAVHVESRGAYSKETSDALLRISNYIDVLGKK